MVRAFLAVAAALLLTATLSVTTHAKSQVVRQWTSPPRFASLTFHTGLLAGHHYKVQISAKSTIKFVANGQEHITYIARGRAGIVDKSLTVKGKTPYTYTVPQPKGVTPVEWIFGMEITARARTRITAKLIDAG